MQMRLAPRDAYGVAIYSIWPNFQLSEDDFVVAIVQVLADCPELVFQMDAILVYDCPESILGFVWNVSVMCCNETLMDDLAVAVNAVAFPSCPDGMNAKWTQRGMVI